MISQLLKLALEQQNWDLIKLIIADLEKTPTVNNNHSISVNTKTQEITPNPSLTQENTPSPIVTPTKSTRKQEMQSFVTKSKNDNPSHNSNEKRQARQTPLPVNVNRQDLMKWHDKLEEHTNETQQTNPQLEKLYGKKPHAKRSEEGDTFQFVHVVCSECQKEEDVSPILAYQYSDNPDENTYRCNSCLRNFIKSRNSND
jgi:hypothetical protein